MQITVFAVRFDGLAWVKWEHTCDKDEAEAIEDSARALALEHSPYQKLLSADYLGAARYIFDVFRGTPEKPVHGDTQVYNVKVGEIVREQYEEPVQAFAAKMSA